MRYFDSALKAIQYKYLRCYFVALCVLLAPLHLPMVVRAQQDNLTKFEHYEDAAQQLEDFMQLLQRLQDEIDMTQFDLEALSFELAFEDAENISYWVHENIEFEQYQGLLRGAEGTLISGAGNSLDQAVLLKTLLVAAGYETRIAQGEISLDDSAGLVHSMEFVPQAHTNSLVADKVAVKAILEEIARYSGDSSDASEAAEAMFAEFYDGDVQDNTEARAISYSLRTALESENIQLNATDRDMLIEEAKDYFWVEQRLSPTDEWQALHPSFISTPNIKVTTRYFDDEIPEDLQHRFAFQVFTEHLSQDKLSIDALTERWEQPSAELAGIRLTYQNYPDNLDVDTTTYPVDDNMLANTLSSASFFHPLLNNQLLEGSQLFDLQGKLYDPKVIAQEAYGTAQLFQTLSDSLGGALSGFGSFGNSPESNEDEFIELTAQWIIYELIAPDGSTKQFKRYVFNRLPEARLPETLRQTEDTTLDPWSEELLAELSQEQTFMLATGRYSKSYVLYKTIEHLQSYRPIFDQTLKANFEETIEIDQSIFAEIDSSWFGHLQLYEFFDQLDFSQYRAEPSLVTYSESLAIDTVTATIDIINNSRRSFDLQGLLYAGVQETFIEKDALPESIKRETRSAAALLYDQELRIIQDSSGLVELKLSVDAKHYMQEDLDNGYILALPRDRIEQEEQTYTAWWRIHSETATTLGRTESGMGQGKTEFISLIYPTTLKIAAAVEIGFFTFVGCTSLAYSAGKGNSKAGTCLGLTVATVFHPFAFLANIGYIFGGILALDDVYN